jgi:hypothetical protein
VIVEFTIPKCPAEIESLKTAFVTLHPRMIASAMAWRFMIPSGPVIDRASKELSEMINAAEPVATSHQGERFGSAISSAPLRGVEIEHRSMVTMPVDSTATCAARLWRF